MLIPPEAGGASIVLVGNFNPAIFNPDWFARYDAATEAECQAATVEVIHSQITAISFDNFQVHIDSERFSIATDHAPYTRIFDFVLQVFGRHLTHTPIGRIGINRMVHFNAGSPEVRDALGHILAPRKPWGTWAKEIDEGNINTKGGLRSLVMEARSTKDRAGGQTRVKIEPSGKSPSWVFMEINDEYHASQLPHSKSGALEIMVILEGNFRKSLRKSEAIIDQIMHTVKGIHL